MKGITSVIRAVLSWDGDAQICIEFSHVEPKLRDKNAVLRIRNRVFWPDPDPVDKCESGFC